LGGAGTHIIFGGFAASELKLTVAFLSTVRISNGVKNSRFKTQDHHTVSASDNPCNGFLCIYVQLILHWTKGGISIAMQSNGLSPKLMIEFQCYPRQTAQTEGALI